MARGTKVESRSLRLRSEKESLARNQRKRRDDHSSTHGRKAERRKIRQRPVRQKEQRQGANREKERATGPKAGSRKNGKVSVTKWYKSRQAGVWKHARGRQRKKGAGQRGGAAEREGQKLREEREEETEGSARLAAFKPCSNEASKKDEEMLKGHEQAGPVLKAGERGRSPVQSGEPAKHNGNLKMEKPHILQNDYLRVTEWNGPTRKTDESNAGTRC